MAAPTITEYYSEDHTRLDGLFESYLKSKGGNSEKALSLLEQFKSGLEQHMAWEEAILFPEFDERIPSPDEESPTVDLRFEHEQLREYLEIVLRKMKENNRDTGKDEARLGELLAAHNWAEETGVYVRLDKALNDSTRAEIYQRMKDAALI